MNNINFIKEWIKHIRHDISEYERLNSKDAFSKGILHKIDRIESNSLELQEENERLTKKLNDFQKRHIEDY